MSGFVYHDLLLNPGPVLRGFAAMIGRAKDELVTPVDYAAFVDGRRRAFEAEFGDWGAAAEAIRRRRTDNELGPIREVRAEVRHSIQAAEKRADREARRQASGTGQAVGRNRLTPEQHDTASSLKGTYLQVAAAFEVLRLSELALVYRALRGRSASAAGRLRRAAAPVIGLFRGRPNVLLRWQRRFRYLLVDEFQDANIAQIELIELVGRGPTGPTTSWSSATTTSRSTASGARATPPSSSSDRFSGPPALRPSEAAGT